MSIDFPAEEELVLSRWREIKAFERQVELNKDKTRYSFMDGPLFSLCSCCVIC
jgi:isoleucyl-tRNA synthetase